jgi:hypothetical protein
VLECPIAAGLYIKFTSDSRAVDLQGFNAAYYVTRVTDGTAISASQVEPERSDWSVRPYCGTPPLPSDFLIRCWIIPTRATDTSALVPVVLESVCGESYAQDCTASTTLTARSGVVKDGSAFKYIASHRADAHRLAPLSALSFFGRLEWTSPMQTRFMGGAGIRTM